MAPLEGSWRHRRLRGDSCGTFMRDVDVPSPTNYISTKITAKMATNGRPYETLAVLQYKTTQKGDQRPPYEIFII